MPHRQGGRRAGPLADIGRAIGDALLETVWPTRCAACDEPGSLLCDRCRARLPFIDRWRACERCGAPFGRLQCTECNPVTLARTGRDALPFEACASAVVLDDRSRRIVTLCKDAGERRLAGVMAELMANVADPAWASRAAAVSWIPATRAAVRRRGFDHAEAVAHAVAERIGLPARALLERPRTKDQRLLAREDRFANMSGRFRARPPEEREGGPAIPKGIVLVDDVHTTGATLFAATDALLEAGADAVFCLTFARAL